MHALFETITTATPDSADEEYFYPLPAELQVTVDDLAALEGLRFPDNQEGVSELTQITHVTTEGYRNMDGLFLRLAVDAVIAYGENRHPNPTSFVIWVDTAEGGETDITDVEPATDRTPDLDPGLLAPVFDRFHL